MKKVKVTVTFADGKSESQDFAYVVEKIMLFSVWGWIDSFRVRPSKIVMEMK
jgi:hypothetical protein